MIGPLALWRRSETGASAVEFALIAPVFCLLLVGAVDFGGMLYTGFNLDGAVSAAGNYALVNASAVTAAAGPALATQLATIVASSHAANWANATIVVNNGPSATLAGGVVTAGGTAANADSCYCPTTGATGVTWGAATSCGTLCANGSVAGKFVTITASRAYAPIFVSYGIVRNKTITVGAVVEAQ